jgi:hypothetical protein
MPMRCCYGERGLGRREMIKCGVKRQAYTMSQDHATTDARLEVYAHGAYPYEMHAHPQRDQRWPEEKARRSKPVDCRPANLVLG